jgi:DNA-binding MarR family transcriptional regulator
VLTDERILGTDDFVGRVLGEADRRRRHLFSSLLTGRQVQQIIAKSCKEEGISIQELQRGSRRGLIPRVRSYLAWKLAREFGVSLAEIGRQLGVSTSAISQILDRKKMR